MMNQNSDIEGLRFINGGDSSVLTVIGKSPEDVINKVSEFLFKGGGIMRTSEGDQAVIWDGVKLVSINKEDTKVFEYTGYGRTIE